VQLSQDGRELAAKGRTINIFMIIDLFSGNSAMKSAKYSMRLRIVERRNP
jgi:hypothetical protein